MCYNYRPLRKVRTEHIKQNTAELKALSVVGHQKSQGCRKSSHQLVTNWMLVAKIQVRIE